MSLVTYEQQESGIGIITLNDPDRLNAMGEDMAQEFVSLCSQLDRQKESIRVLILTGAGRAFSAGGDLHMLEKKRELSKEENQRRMLDFYHSFLGILDLEVPLIAAINGHAIGAGLCVACACDVRICADQAKLGFTFTKLGLHPGMGATWFLPKIIGASLATELMITGRVVSAEQGLQMGLVSQLTRAEDNLTVAKTVAEEIASCGPESVRQVLGSVRSTKADLELALEREASCQSVNYASQEFAEGVRAAIEKRTARFSATSS